MNKPTMNVFPSEFTKENQRKNSQKNQIIYWLLGSLLLVTVLATTHYFRISMMGLATFFLAYLSKGIRRKKSN